MCQVHPGGVGWVCVCGSALMATKPPRRVASWRGGAGVRCAPRAVRCRRLRPGPAAWNGFKLVWRRAGAARLDPRRGPHFEGSEKIPKVLTHRVIGTHQGAFLCVGILGRGVSCVLEYIYLFLFFIYDACAVRCGIYSYTPWDSAHHRRIIARRRAACAQSARAHTPAHGSRSGSRHTRPSHPTPHWTAHTPQRVLDSESNVGKL